MRICIPSLLLLILVYCLSACAPKHEVQIQTFRDKKNRDFKKASGSPIPYDDRKEFKGLVYYPVDTSFLTTGNFEVMADKKIRTLRTSTGKERNFRKYGKASFILKEKMYTLYIYQAIEDDNSFSILFTDSTNGEETYEVGRYVEPIITGNKITIDFNKAYNPYCVYDKKFDCPIPPEENHLEIKIEAGEKMYVK